MTFLCRFIRKKRRKNPWIIEKFVEPRAGSLESQFTLCSLAGRQSGVGASLLVCDWHIQLRFFTSFVSSRIVKNSFRSTNTRLATNTKPKEIHRKSKSVMKTTLLHFRFIRLFYFSFARFVIRIEGKAHSRVGLYEHNRSGFSLELREGEEKKKLKLIGNDYETRLELCFSFHSPKCERTKNGKWNLCAFLLLLLDNFENFYDHIRKL